MTGAIDTAIGTALGMMVARIVASAPLSFFDGRTRVGDIIDAVAWHTGVTKSDITGPNRGRSYFRPRAAVCWIAIQLGGASTTTIAQVLGGRDHTSIVNANRRAHELRQRDPAFLRLTDRLLQHFRDLQED